MMVISDNARQVTEEGKFSCAVCRKDIDRCWVHKRYSNVKGTLKEDSKCKCQICANQQTDMAEGEGCPGI